MTLSVYPLTPDRWTDFETLFTEASGPRNCWCMWWRLAGKDWKASDKATRKGGLKAVVDAGPPGLVAYDGDVPVGWVQITPRADVPRFNNGRTSKPEPDTCLQSTWALTCFYTARSHRRQGLMAAMARGACFHAVQNGARCVEATPIRPKELRRSDGYFGVVPAFERAGFAQIAPRGPNRVLMRWTAVRPTRPSFEYAAQPTIRQ